MQGLTDQRLGKIPTSCPNASRQLFLTLVHTHKGDVKCAFLQRDVDEQREDDKDDDVCKIESAQPVSDTFCEPVPELSRKLQLEHHQCVRLLKVVYGLVNAPRKGYHRVATDLGKHERGRISHGTLLVDIPGRKRRHSCSVCWYMSMTSCWRSVTLHLENMSLIASTICMNGELGSHECSHSAAHESHKPTIKTPEHGADLRSASLQNTAQCLRVRKTEAEMCGMFAVTLALESCMICGVSSRAKRLFCVRPTRGTVALINMHTSNCFILHLPQSLSIATLAAGMFTALVWESVCAPCCGAKWKHDIGPSCGPYAFFRTLCGSNSLRFNGCVLMFLL